MKKQFISVLLTAGLALSMAAGVYADEAAAFDDYTRPAVVADEDVSIIYLVSNLNDESNIRPENQVEVECAHRGWDFQCINYETEDNFRQYMQNAINQEPTAIIIGVTQSFDSYQDLIDDARGRGIGIYSLDNGVIPGVICNAGMDNTECALAIMEQLEKDYPDGLNYCVFELAMGPVITIRANAAEGYADDHEGFTLLDTKDIASTGDLNTGGYTLCQSWIQQFPEMQCVVGNADPPAMSACEAVTQAGKEDEIVVTGVDGGSSTWAYIRQGSPLKYTYSQPFEFYAHMTCEAIKNIQVDGLNPGEESCIVDEVGGQLIAKGIVTTVDNCPQPGDSIHSVFDFYGEDPEAEDAWYTWNDGPGIYAVTE